MILSIQSTAMKLMGQVKEANRFLRGVDFDQATDTFNKREVMVSIGVTGDF